jgi:hypothetical protein
MRLSHVYPGMQYGVVKIIAVKRIRAHSEITFTDGRTERTVLLHKGQSLATALTGPLASMSLDRRTMERPAHRPRVSDPEWRGGDSGRKGERFVARNGAWDRATKETTPRA